MSSSAFSERTVLNHNDNLQEKSVKKFRSTNAWLENKKLQTALDETRALLEEERVEKLGQLSQAVWIPTIQLAKVTKQVGRQWMTMGHHYLGDLVLHPEEALFLLETNTIEISFGGLPMSLQQAYSVLLGADTGCTLEEYRAYAHLTRYGYRVRRHKQEQRTSRGRQDMEDQPLEVDVVGIIRKRKSSDGPRSEKVVEIEDTVEVVSREKHGYPSKRPFSNVDEPYPSTSGFNSVVKHMSSEDDDIKFIEVIDASKKRKVAGTIVINDDIEITASYANEANQCVNQVKTLSNNKNEELPECTDIGNKNEELPECTDIGNKNEELPECTDIGIKKETAKTLRDSFDSSLDVELMNNSSDVNKPSRGMYNSRPLASLSNDAEPSENMPTANGQHEGTENSLREAEVLKDKASPAKKLRTGCDDVIVLSDDEAKEGSAKSREMLRFYKEISLIELIDISEEDEGEKSASKQIVNGKDRIASDNYDFWGILGRIPIRHNGRMILKIPAPPSNLIPPNTRPVKDEYAVNLIASIDKPSEESSANARPTQESQRQSREGKSDNSLQPRETQSHRVPPRQIMTLVGAAAQNPWNSWYSRNNDYQYAQNIGTSFQLNSFSSNHYQGSDSIPPWFSYVYPQRQSNYSITTQFQSWIPQSFSQNYQPTQHLNYPQHHLQYLNQSGNWNRQLTGQSNSSFSNVRGSGATWQQAWAPRRGNGHYRRSNINSFNSRQNCNKTPRVSPGEAENRNVSVVPKKPDAQSWSEMKRNGDKQKNTEPSDEFQTDSKKDILPLLKPSDSISTDAVHSKLQITNSAKHNCYDTPEKSKNSLSVKFDLYLPNSNFRKSCPGIPRYRLSVVKSNDQIPRLEDTMYLKKKLNDEVPLLFAVGFPDNINFFSFSNVELPVQLAKSN